MKKAVIVVVVLAAILTGTAALASDAVVYSDEELGFSFEMPADFEYHEDISAEVAESLGTDKIEKQPMYLGYNSNVIITYTKGDEEFNILEKRLPKEVIRDELDFYLLTEDDKEEYIQSIAQGLTEVGLDNEIISSQWADYGGKFCAVIDTKGYDAASGYHYYQSIVSFMYRDYFLSVTYTKTFIEGTLSERDAKAEFDKSFNTLKFDIVPSDKDAKLESGISIDWTEAAIYGVVGAVVAGLAGLIVYLVNKNKVKKKQREDRDENGNIG